MWVCECESRERGWRKEAVWECWLTRKLQQSGSIQQRGKKETKVSGGDAAQGAAYSNKQEAWWGQGGEGTKKRG